MAEVVNDAVADANQQSDASEPVEENVETCPIELILTVRRIQEWAKSPEGATQDAEEGGTIGEFDLKKTGVEAALVTGFMLEAAGPSSKKAGSDQRVQAGTYWLIRNPGKIGRYRLVQTTQTAAEASFGERSLVNIHRGNKPTDLKGCLLPGSSWEEKGKEAKDKYPYISGSKDKMTELENAISEHAKTEIRTTYDGELTYTDKTFYCNVLVVIHEISASSSRN